MLEISELLHTWLNQFSNIVIFVLELMGVIVILFAGVRAFFSYWHGHAGTRLKLAKSMAMALEFKLGSEILRTVVVRDFKEIALVGCIIALRAALTFLIHWEIHTEEEEEKQRRHEEQAMRAKERLLHKQIRLHRVRNKLNDMQKDSTQNSK